MAAGDGAGERAIRAATAVELLHMATLVHDDVLDGAPVRRGRPTVVARSGRDRAVGVGDLLLSRAFAELAGRRRWCGGRRAQLGLGRARARRAGPAQRCIRHVDQRGALSGALLPEDREAVRVRLPAGAPRLGGPGTEELATFGGEIGLAFQLLDDVLDVTGPPERTGKARGTDLLDGTVTLPLILARRLDPGLESVELRGPRRAPARRRSATGSRRPVPSMRCGSVPRRGSSAPRDLIGSEDFTDEERQLLGMIADGVVERYS